MQLFAIDLEDLHLRPFCYTVLGNVMPCVLLWPIFSSIWFKSANANNGTINKTKIVIKGSTYLSCSVTIIFHKMRLYDSMIEVCDEDAGE